MREILYTVEDLETGTIEEYDDLDDYKDAIRDPFLETALEYGSMEAIIRNQFKQDVLNSKNYFFYLDLYSEFADPDRKSFETIFKYSWTDIFELILKADYGMSYEEYSRDFLEGVIDDMLDYGETSCWGYLPTAFPFGTNGKKYIDLAEAMDLGGEGLEFGRYKFKVVDLDEE